MSTVTRINRQAFDTAGTLSGQHGLEIAVHFDLVELEDVTDGIPGSKFSYGVLRFREPLAPGVEPLLLSTSRLILTGGGVQFLLCLYRLTSFTVLEAIRTVTTISQPPAQDERAAA